MTLRRLAACVVILLILPAFSGCCVAAAAGAGAYVGYKAKEEGYSLQNPVTKADSKSSDKRSE